MADQSPAPDSPLLAQLQTTLEQLERVARQLESDPQSRQPLDPQTLARLQSSLDSLQRLGGERPPGSTAQRLRETAPSEWDEAFVEALQPPVSQSLQPPPRPSRPPTETQRRSPSVSAKRGLSRTKKSKFPLLSAIATGLLGILVGIILWVRIPPLDLPPLWDQIATRIPPLPDLLARDVAVPSAPTSPDAELAVEDEGELPAVLEAPSPPTAIAIEPLPTAPLTPEQSLLAAIQQEVTDLEGLYPPQLIQRIEPNFLASRLTLTVGDNWQQLSAKQRQTLLDTLWQRAQKLSFQRLWIYSPAGELIARSPVVGQKMVAFQSSDPMTD